MISGVHVPDLSVENDEIFLGHVSVHGHSWMPLKEGVRKRER